MILCVHGELNPISAPGFPIRDETPALPQLNHCPAQGKSTSLCPCLYAHFVSSQDLSYQVWNQSLTTVHLVFNSSDFKVQS